MQIDRSNIFEIINKCNVRPDKDYGQNFLVEPSICEKIVSFIGIEPSDEVLEIGPGLGSLTNFICKSGVKTTAVDIDERMISFLRVSLQEFSNLSLVNDDIRRVDVSSFTKIVANLPYNITTEVIIYLLQNALKAKKLVLMCQSETFAHFFDVEGKEYGPSSVLVHLCGSIKKLLTVKAGSFHPVPKCNSIVFEIELIRELEYDKVIKTYNLSKQLFLNRRKTIYNNLSNYLKNKDKAESLLKQLNIPLNYRPEQISPDTYYQMSALID